MSDIVKIERQDQFGLFEIYHNESKGCAPIVSVVMSAFNNALVVEKSIESILNQSFHDFEFIIIDDGSSDSTFEKLCEFFKRDPRVVLIRNSGNIGLTKSLIRGIDSSRGQFIARQDSDDYSDVRRLEIQLSYVPAYDFVCCRTKVNGKKVSPKLPSTWFYRHILAFKNVFVHGSFLFKKQIYLQLGGYNPEFVYAQDYDFVSRFARSPYKIKYLKDVLYYSNKDKQSISRRLLGQQNEYAQKVRRSYRLIN